MNPGAAALARKRRLGRAWRQVRTWAGRSAAPRAVVLLYHTVGSSPWAVSAERFAEQMAVLRARARVVDLGALLTARDERPPLACAITFDDGYASVYEAASPILRDHGFPATVYLTTDAIDHDEANASDRFPGLHPAERLMRWDQVRELQAHGTAIGSHLCAHPDMTRLAPDEAMRQLRASKAAIEQRLGVPCDRFAYPFGRCNRQVAGWVREAGYRTAVAGFHAPITPGVDPYEIPRFQIRPEYTPADFEAILAGDWDYLGPVQRIRHRLAV